MIDISFFCFILSLSCYSFLVLDHITKEDTVMPCYIAKKLG